MNLAEKRAYAKNLAIRSNQILNEIRQMGTTADNVYLGSKWNEILRQIGTKSTKQPKFKIGTSRLNAAKTIAYGQQLHKFISEYEKHKKSFESGANRAGMSIMDIIKMVDILGQLGVDTTVSKIYNNTDRHGDIATIVNNKLNAGMSLNDIKNNLQQLEYTAQQNEIEIDNLIDDFSNYGEWL